MKCEVVAVGSELLLGQIVDTNSAWIADRLALAGIDAHFHAKVGDNHERMVSVIAQALERSDAVVVCGGLGPTQDDITREAIAEVMGVPLVRDPDLAERIRAKFSGRGRRMPDNNLRQADVPQGAQVIPVIPGTAPGLICPLDGERSGKVIYAVPGVPWEMKQMMTGSVLADLAQRSGSRSVIASRTLRTWGQSESGLAELLDDEIRRLDRSGEATIAFLASGAEGLKVRITTKAESSDEAKAALDIVEARLRRVIGDITFGTDDDTMESVVLEMLRSRGMTLGLAESLTGGMIASRITSVAGCSDVFRGSVVAYQRDLKMSLLDAPDTAAVSAEMASAMAVGACEALGSDCAIAVTGVAGPQPLEGNEAGCVFIAVCIQGDVESFRVDLPFDRERIRQLTCIMSLNMLRTRLLARTP